MKSKTRNPQSLDLPLAFFAAREQAGPLTALEECFRAICTSGFFRLVDCDEVMVSGWPTSAGFRWLVPVIRQVLRFDGELPVLAIDWIRLFHRARAEAMQHFSDWNARTGGAASSKMWRNPDHPEKPTPRRKNPGSAVVRPLPQSIH